MYLVGFILLEIFTSMFLGDISRYSIGFGGSLVTKLCPTFATAWTIGHQAPLSMGFLRWEYWSGLPFPFPGDLPDPGIKSGSPALQVYSLLTEPPGKPQDMVYTNNNNKKMSWGCLLLSIPCNLFVQFGVISILRVWQNLSVTLKDPDT